MTDDYLGEDEHAFSKYIGHNFCAISWAGIAEHDIPLVYYFYNNCQNNIPAVNQEREEMMVNVVQKSIGLMLAAYNLAGGNGLQYFCTQTFSSYRYLLAVRRVFPYHITLSVEQPCGEAALMYILNMVTQIAFYESRTDKVTPFVPYSHQNTAYPDSPLYHSGGLYEQMLNGLLLRFFEDQMCRLSLGSYHGLYMPKDIVSPYLLALYLIKATQRAQPGCTVAVLKNGRVLLSTAGPFMTNYACLLTGCAPAAHNRRVHYAFGSYFADRAPQSAFQDGAHPDERFMSFSTLYISNLAAGRAYVLILSAYPVAMRPGALQAQIQQLDDRLQPQSQTPPVYGPLDEYTYPVAAPAPGAAAVCGVDAGGFYRSLRGVYTGCEHGASTLDAAIVDFCAGRDIMSATIVLNYAEPAHRTPHALEEFYAFCTAATASGGLISGGIAAVPMVAAVYGRDPTCGVYSAGAAPIEPSSNVKTTIQTIYELTEIYVRISWQ